jgi:uncharacterized delta-60 repeat protein/RHS repeat-associated protein
MGRWKKASKRRATDRQRRLRGSFARRLCIEPLESRQLLSVAVADDPASAAGVLSPVDAQAIEDANAAVARLRPLPHVGGQEHSAADGIGPVQVAKLVSYTPAELPTVPRELGPVLATIPGLTKYFQAYRAGLAQLHQDIQKNADARPMIWGNATVSGGGDYRLNFDNNGMVVASWTVDWGDGSPPEQVENQPWVMHHYADRSARYTITATATSSEESGVAEYATSRGDSRGGSLDRAFTGVHKPTQAIDDIFSPIATSDALASDAGGTITLDGGTESTTTSADTLDAGQMMTLDAGGELDPNFGKIVTNFNSNSGFDEGRAVAIQGTSILVAGGIGAGDFGLARYLDDGSLDTSFDTDGLVTTHFTAGSAIANAVAVNANEIVAAGVVDTGGGTGEIALAQYDPSTGQCLWSITDNLSTGWDEARAVLILEDDSIIVAGSSDGQFVLLHYGSDGVRDTSFGGATDGIVITTFGGSASDAYALAFDSWGGILAAGSAEHDATARDFALARYNTDGTLDAGFGNNGIAGADFDGNSDEARAIAVQSDGAIVVAGYTYNAFQDDSALVRFTPEGYLDRSFGQDGFVTTDFNGGSDRATGVVVQSDGRIIAAGWAQDTSAIDHFALARYNPDGSLDSATFGTDGKVVTDFSDLGFDSEDAHGIALDPDGNYVVAGTAYQSTFSSFAVARYTPGTQGITVEVQNVPPRLSVVGHQDATAGLSLDLPSMATFTHPGSLTGETFTYQIDWGDGTVDSDTLNDLTGDPLILASFDGSHTYTDTGYYYVAVTVTDADGGSETQTFSVTVNGDPDLPADAALKDAVRQALGLSAEASVGDAEWARLTTLTADSNKVLSLEGLQYATNLVSLTLVPSDFTEPGHLTSLARLQDLKNLQSLTLQRCGLSGSELTSAVLSTLTSLTTLDLRYNNIAVLPAATAGLSKLNTLYVYGNALTDAPQAGLANLAGKPINVDVPADHPEKALLAADPIADLAARLYKLPLKMYEYVLNTIEYQPYEGAMKGPLAVLQTAAGNDWDTASLLAGLFQAAGISTSYVSGQIQVPVEQAEDYVGATAPLSAQYILDNAAAHPIGILDGSGRTTDIRFDHAWLQAQIGSTTYYLDPSWKFRDFRPGIPDLFSQRPFDQAAYQTATSEQQKHSAAEFYEDQVRGFLSTHYPDKTIVDVAHDGPIRPQTITALSTGVPYTVPAVYWTGTAIPDSKKHQVEIKLQNDAQTVTYFTWTGFVPDISLQRLTVEPNIVGSDATPRLLKDGSPQATSNTTVPKTTSLALVVSQISPDPSRSYSRTYKRTADRYLAIGLDAGQMSEHLLRKLRTTVNTQELNEVNSQGVDRDAEIGGILALAMATYFHDADEGEKTIAGLTGAVPDYTYVASGLATSSTEIVSPNDNLKKVQMPYQPKGMGIDVPGNRWHLNPINGDFSLNVSRDLLSGYHNSSMEGLIWEELSNYDSISTMKALQLASQQSIPFATVTSSDSRDSLNTLLPLTGLSSPVASTIRDHIYDYAHNQDYSVYVPKQPVTVGNGSQPNPNGAWSGVGYTLTVPASGAVDGYIIDDGVGAPHGGGAYGDLLTPVVPVTTGYGLDPIGTTNGDVWHGETDLSIPNLGTPLTFARHYHSFDTADMPATIRSLAPDRGIGDGWSFSYSDRLMTDGSDKVWITDNGTPLRFTPKTGGGWNTPAMIFGSLTQDGSNNFIWTDKSGNVVTFSNSTTGSPGYLQSRSDRYGNGVGVHYKTGVTGDMDYVCDLCDTSRRLTFTYNSDTPHHITAIADFTGRTWLYQYNTDHRLVSVSAPSAFGTPLTMTQYAYFPENETARKGLLQQVTDPNGNATKFDYYANRRGMSVTDAEQNISSATYNIFRQQTAQIAANALATDYSYDNKGNIAEVRSPDGTTVTATWNTDKGLKLTSTDAFGQQETYSYWDYEVGNLKDFTDRLGHVTHYTYTARNDVDTITRQSDNTVTDYDYYADGTLQKLTDAESNVTSYTYANWLRDTNGNGLYDSNDSYMPPSIAPDVPSDLQNGIPVVGDWNNQDNKAEIGLYRSGSWWLDRNANGRYDSSTPYGDERFSYTHWTAETPVTGRWSDSDAYPHVGNFYQGQWWLEGRTGNPVSFGTSGNVPVVGDWNGDGKDEIGVYDPQTFKWYLDSNRNWTLDSSEQTNAYTFGWTGGVPVVGNWTTSHAGDEIGMYRPDLGAWQLDTGNGQWDSGDTVYNLTGQTPVAGDWNGDGKDEIGVYSVYRGLPDSVTAPKGALTSGDPSDYKTTFTYSAGGQTLTQIARVSSSETIATASSYDNRGSLTSSTDGRGNMTSYTNDVLGRPMSQTQPDPDGSGPLVQPVTTFVYDAANNLLSTSLATSFPQQTVTSAYDKMQQVTKATSADSTYTTMQFDAAANVTVTTDAMGRDTEFVYDSQNRPVAAVRADDTVVTTAYNGGGEVVATTDAKDNTTEYAYDPLGRKIKDIQINPAGYTASDIAAYSGYDPSGRLGVVVAPSLITVPDGGFEAATNVPENGFTYYPSGSNWTFTPNGGIADGTGFGNAKVPQGRHVALLQQTGYFTQSVSFPSAGTYTIGFKAAYRDGYAGANPFQVWVGAQNVGQFTPTTSSTYRDYLVSFSVATAGSYTVKFLGTTPSPTDKSSFIDAVWISAGGAAFYGYGPLGDLSYVDAPAPISIPDYGFEAATNVPQNGFTYYPSGSNWTFTGTSGIANGTGFDNATVPEGRQVAFLQQTGYFSQNVTLATGTYTIGFQAAYRNGYDGANPFKVEIIGGGQTLDLGTFTPTTYYTYQGYLFSFSIATAGSYSIKFMGLTSSPTDKSSFIDAVWISPGSPVSGTATTLFSYDPQGNLQYVTDALGKGSDDTSHTTQYYHDKIGRQTAIKSPDPDGSGALVRPITLFTYDANSNLVSTVDARGASDDTLDSYGNSTSDVSGNNAAHKTEYTYDEKGRRIQEKLPDPDGTGGPLTNLYTWFYYDSNGNLTHVVDPNGATGTRPATPPTPADHVTQYDYDALNRKTKETQPYPNSSDHSIPRPTTDYAYDNSGNLASVTDPNRNVTRFIYDLKNRQTQVTDALGAYAGDPAHTTTTTFDAVGNAILVTDALGRITATQYDSLNRKVSQTLPRPDSTAASAPQALWDYDYNGNLYRTTDPRGNISYILYNGRNLPVETIDPLNHTTITSYDPLGRVTSVTDELGRTTQYIYDNLGRRIQRTEPDPDDYTMSGGSDGAGLSPRTYYGYDLNGNLKWVTDPRGNAPNPSTGALDWNYTTAYFYDALDRPACTIDPKIGATQTWTVSTIPDTAPAYSPGDRSIRTTYDALGDVATTSDQLGHTTTYQYDNLGRKKAELAPYAYSDVGSTPTYMQATTTFAYDANGNLLSTTDPLNHTTWTSYDALNRPVRSVSALGSGPNDTRYATTTTYDAVGNVTAVTDPTGNITRYLFDRLGREVKETDPLWNSRLFQYDLAGNMVQKIDRENRATQYVYDQLGRQTQEKWLDANGDLFHTIQTNYDAAGEMVGVSETDVATALHTATPVARTDYQYIYDRDGRVIRKRMAPRDLSQPAATQVNGSVTNPAAYVLADSPASVRTGDIIHISIVGTGFNPSVKIVRPNSNFVLVNNGGGAYSVDLTADDPLHDPGTWEIWVGSADGNTGSFTLQWQINPALPLALARLSYTYYADGSIASIADSANGLTEYQYDAMGRMTQEKQTGTGVANKLVDFAYYDNGATQTITRYAAATEDNNYKVVTSTYLYDEMGRTTSLAHVFGSNNSGYIWEYDAASRMVKMNSGDGTTDLRTSGYDANNQIKAVDYDYQGDEAYSYDTNGNRVNADWKTGAANRLLTSPISGVVYTYAYDKEGNRTERFRDINGNGVLDTGDTNVTLYHYDQRNRLDEVAVLTGYAGTITEVIDYSYDYADRRVARILDSNGDLVADEYRYNISQGSDAVIEIYDQDGLSGGTYSPYVSHRYVFGPAADQILITETIVTPGQAGTLRYGLGDDNGTIRDVLQFTPGNWTWDWRQYDSFGKVSYSTDAFANFAFGLNGMPIDADAYLYQTDTVAYDPLTARRLSEDWIGFGSGSTNFTIWAGNNPWNQIDPSGMLSYGGSAYTGIHTTAESIVPAFTGFTGSTYNVVGGSLPGYSPITIPYSTSSLSSMGYSSLGGSVVVPSYSTFTSSLSTAAVTLSSPASSLNVGSIGPYTMSSASLPGYSPLTIPSAANLSSLGFSTIGGSVVVPSYSTFASAFSTASAPPTSPSTIAGSGVIGVGGTISSLQLSQVNAAGNPQTGVYQIGGGYAGNLNIMNDSILQRGPVNPTQASTVAAAASAAAVRVDRAIDLLENNHPQLRAIMNPPTPYNLEHPTVVGGMRTEEGRNRMLSQLYTVRNALNNPSVYTNIVLDPVNSGSATAGRKAYVNFLEYGGINTNIVTSYIHVIPRFFTAPATERAETLLHEFARYYNSLGETNTDTWYDAQAWDTRIEWLNGVYDAARAAAKK